ncbi:MAG: hypothetical protein KTR25_17720 [Myxococcales bacterium]|nr:hypothetical protein [Myxococcales bacterium]
MELAASDELDQERVLTLIAPDWQHLDAVLESPIPFVLWVVGAQPLLHHWLDHAVDEGYGRVRLLVSDRPAEVRQAMEKAKLWPVQWEIIPRSTTEVPTDLPSDVACLDHLPGHPPLNQSPTNGWELLRYWFTLRETWFASVDSDHMEAFRTLAVGRFCSIHPSAELRMPIWIDDYAQIGPGCVVGPNVNIGRGAVLEGPSKVTNSVITDHTYLAGHTELQDAFLDGGRLLNLRLGARVNLDRLMADHLKSEDVRRPSLVERIGSSFLYLVFSLADRLLPGRTAKPTEWMSFDGLQLSESSGPLWRRRRTWLKHVMQGRMRLVGVLPRTREQFDQLSPDWQEIIRAAPSGILSYADLHGSHSANDELEAVHAVYQASSPGAEIRSTIREQAWRLFRITHDRETAVSKRHRIQS